MIYWVFWLHVAQGYMNGVPSEHHTQKLYEKLKLIYNVQTNEILLIENFTY